MKLVVHNRYVEAVKFEQFQIKLLRKILTIDNPKAKYKGKQTRFYNKDVKQAYEFLDDECRFLRGLLPFVEDKLQEAGVEYTVESKIKDSRTKVTVPVDLLPNATLRDYQQMAIEVAFYEQRGVVQVATGGGKTIICAGMCKMVEQARKGARSVTFVNKQKLMRQTVEAYKRYGLSGVGWIGKGEYEPGQHMVVMVQTAVRLAKRGDLDWAENVDLVNWDETHHIGADSWVMLAKGIESKWSVGYSGTPFRQGEENYEDPADVQMLGITGGLIVKVPASYLIKRGLLAKPYIFMVPISRTDQDLPSDSWAPVERAWITDNGIRNSLIVKLTKALVERGLHPLVIVSKLKHGEQLVELMGEAGLKPVFSSGGPKKTTYIPGIGAGTVEDIEVSGGEISAIHYYNAGDYNVLIGSSVFDEGVDLPAVPAVINGAGGKSFIKNLQRVGRGLRPKADDNSAYIFDFIDKGHKWLKSHSRERIKDYSTEEEYEIFEGIKATVEFFDEEWYL